MISDYCSVCGDPITQPVGRGRPRKYCGVRCCGIASYRRANGIPIYGPPGPRGTRSDVARRAEVRRAEVIAAVTNCGSQSEAARLLGISRQRVNQIVLEQHRSAA